MLKKSVSILMLFSALVMMLGHSSIPHCHGENGHHDHAHHHHSDDHPSDQSDNNSDYWNHFFCHIAHGDFEAVLLIGQQNQTTPKQLFPKLNLIANSFSFWGLVASNCQIIPTPPLIADYYNSQNCLPSGLRAPPVIIV